MKEANIMSRKSIMKHRKKVKPNLKQREAMIL